MELMRRCYNVGCIRSSIEQFDHSLVFGGKRHKYFLEKTIQLLYLETNSIFRPTCYMKFKLTSNKRNNFKIQKNKIKNEKIKKTISWTSIRCHFRLIPCEVGREFREENWILTVVSLKKYLLRILFCDQLVSLYLAQNENINQFLGSKFLPDFIKQIKNDINKKVEKIYSRSWMGSVETHTPIHYDEKNNMICQLQGSKLVVVIFPKNVSQLYSYGFKHLLYNTSQLNNIYCKLGHFPLSSKITLENFIVHLEDYLFLPKHIWHSMIGLTPSTSFNFWF